MELFPNHFDEFIGSEFLSIFECFGCGSNYLSCIFTHKDCM